MPPEKKNTISACVLTCNNETTIAACVESLTPFEEVVVMDTGSTDRTLEILSQYPKVRVCHATPGKIRHFGEIRNELASFARFDWVCMVDSDEVVSPELAGEILAEPLDPKTIYALFRVNYYHGRPIKGCGIYPDYIKRVYHRGQVHWGDRIVHEALVFPEGGRVKHLRAVLHHYPNDSIDTLLDKMNYYTTLFADQRTGKRKATPLLALGHGMWRFFKTFLLGRGFLYGQDGFVICLTAGLDSYFKHAKLYERNKCRDGRERENKDCIQKPSQKR